MTIEAPNSESISYEPSNDEKENGELDGREVRVKDSDELIQFVASAFYVGGVLQPQVCSYNVRGKEPSFFDNYFDSEAKKQNKFDIAVYQHHIRCNSEESKKHLEKSFEMMATGMVGVIVGVATFLQNPVKGGWMIFVVAERVWKGVEEFKKAMETSNTPLENVHFFTWYDDLERNTEELTKNSILSHF